MGRIRIYFPARPFAFHRAMGFGDHCTLPVRGGHMHHMQDDPIVPAAQIMRAVLEKSAVKYYSLRSTRMTGSQARPRGSKQRSAISLRPFRPALRQ